MRRSDGYIRREITLDEDAADAVEIWRCEACGRWHSFDNGCVDTRPFLCDSCWYDKEAAQ